MDERQIKSKVADGYLYVRVILEIVGKPKEHVEESLKDYVKKIKADKNHVIVKEKTEKAEPHQDDLFSAFSEIEMLMKNSDALLSFCFDYMPSSIEIIEPERIILKNSEFNGFINDMLSRTISLNTTVLEMQERANYYISNTAVLLRNFLVVLFSSRPMTLKQASQYLGIKEQDTLKVIDVLIKEGKVKKNQDKYIAVEKKNE